MNSRTFIVLGNSLVRRLTIPDVEVISINGLDWEGARKYMIDNRRLFIDKHVYILVGPLRFTSLHRSRREVAFCGHNLHTVHQLFAPFYNELSFLHISPVVCPLFPMNFTMYNGLTARRPIMTSFYNDWNAKIRGHVATENRHIMRFNTKYNVLAPCLNNRIFHRKKQHYAFRDRYLRDGLHVTQQILDEWAVEFQRVILKYTT
jgi:hypothetical protein